MAQVFNPSLAQTIGVFPEENPLARDVVAAFQQGAQRKREIVEQRNTQVRQAEALRTVLSARNPVFRTMPAEQQDQIISSVVGGGSEFIGAALQPDAFSGVLPRNDSGQGPAIFQSSADLFSRAVRSVAGSAFGPETAESLFTRPAPQSQDPGVPVASAPIQGVRAGGNVPSIIQSSTPDVRVEQSLVDQAAVEGSSVATRQPIDQTPEGQARGRLLAGRLRSLRRTLKRSGSDIDISNKAITETAKELGVSKIEVIKRLIRKGQQKGLIR